MSMKHRASSTHRMDARQTQRKK